MIQVDTVDSPLLDFFLGGGLSAGGRIGLNEDLSIKTNIAPVCIEISK